MSTRPQYFTELVPGRRGEILDAALAVFAAKRYTAGTMREIAAAVGVTEPALYRYWPGKEALFGEMIATAGDHIAAQARTVLAGACPETLRAALLALLRMRRAQGEVGRMPVIATLLMAAPVEAPLADAFREHAVLPVLAEVAALVPRIDAALGIVRSPAEAAGAARAFLSLFIGHFVAARFLEGPGDDGACVEAMLAVMGWEDVA